MKSVASKFSMSSKAFRLGQVADTIASTIVSARKREIFLIKAYYDILNFNDWSYLDARDWEAFFYAEEVCENAYATFCGSVEWWGSVCQRLDWAESQAAEDRAFACYEDRYYSNR